MLIVSLPDAGYLHMFGITISDSNSRNAHAVQRKEERKKKERKKEKYVVCSDLSKS